MGGRVFSTITRISMSLAEKLSSRKLWIAFAVIVLTAFSSQFGLQMDLGQWLTLGLATLGYSVGQGWVDAANGSSASGERK